ncbi:MAG: sucrase ferredoxin [Actinomycetota bacterium]|nr:sucrase ferredoxin [Actinomycetota bacterium]
MAARVFRCADAAEARAEPLYGTASVVRKWLLIEQPGSWGYDPLTQSLFPKKAAWELRERTRAAGIRIVLIRRGVRLSSPQRQCYFARTEDRRLHLSRLTVESLNDLLDVDLAPLSDGGLITGAVERRAPLFLVCTHGRHDACCAIRGNQVSRVACAVPEADAWECAHIGGDRFAANVVCFPHGVYYGRVAPQDVAALMDAYGDGRLSLGHYRGRCCHSYAVQAAEYFVRRESGTTRIDDLWLAKVSRKDERGLTATFTMVHGRQAEVKIRVSQTTKGYRLTCGASGTSFIPGYELDSLAFAASR